MGKARLLDELPSIQARPIELITVLVNGIEPKVGSPCYGWGETRDSAWASHPDRTDQPESPRCYDSYARWANHLLEKICNRA